MIAVVWMLSSVLLAAGTGEVSFVKPYQGGSQQRGPQGGPEAAPVQEISDEDEEDGDDDNDDPMEGDEYSDADFTGVEGPTEESDALEESAPDFHDDNPQDKSYSEDQDNPFK